MNRVSSQHDRRRLFLARVLARTTINSVQILHTFPLESQVILGSKFLIPNPSTSCLLLYPHSQVHRHHERSHQLER